MDENRMCLTILGARGSMAVSRKDREIFGGATSCYMVRAGEETVFLDAGSGLLSAPTEMPKPPHILLSHLHLDHVIGLGMYSRLSQNGAETVLHVPAGPGEDPEKLMDRIYSPPFWPVNLGAYAGSVRILPLSFPLRIGELNVEGTEGSHPGECMLMRLSYRGRSLVYATDYEYEESSFAHLTELARGADLLLYDGQYSIEQYATRQGFGHSATDHALTMMRQSGAKRMLLVHHDPCSSDEILLDREKRLGLENVRYAREGETIEL